MERCGKRQAPSLDGLSDELLLRILGYVKEYSSISRCRLVNKRWRDLCWRVPRLSLSFFLKDGGDRRLQQWASCFFREINQRGKQSLVELSIRMNGMLAKQTPIHWLGHALNGVLEKLTLDAEHCTLNVESLLVPLTTCQNLTYFGVGGEDAQVQVTGSVLERLLGACPSLKELSVHNLVTTDSPLKITSASASLEKFSISCCGNLALVVEFSSAKEVKIKNFPTLILDAPELCALGLVWDNQYKFVLQSRVGFRNVKRLSLWKCEIHTNVWGHNGGFGELIRTLKLTPGVQELHIKWNGFRVFPKDAKIGMLFKMLPQLKKVLFAGNLFDWFAGVTVGGIEMKHMEIAVDPSFGIHGCQRTLTVFKAFLEQCCLKKLLVVNTPNVTPDYMVFKAEVSKLAAAFPDRVHWMQPESARNILRSIRFD